MQWRMIIPVWLLVVSACNDLPKDPDDSMEKIQKAGVIRVGVSHNLPWVDMSKGALPGGIEPVLIEKFAATLPVKVEWREDTEQDLVQQLKEGRINLIISGMTEESPWKKEIGTTYAYWKGEKKHVIAVRQGENALLTRLERFLRENQVEIEQLVRQNNQPSDE